MKKIEKSQPWQRTVTAAALALTVASLPSIAFAHQNSTGMVGQNQTQPDQKQSQGVSQSGEGANAGGYYGPGMMRGGYGPEMMRGGYGPGMMEGGYGPGMMGGGYGPGMMGGGYGPGMMGGGYGPGMMGGGYGPGMMGGGYGPSMMGGYGPGMMRGYGFGSRAMAGLDLSADQRHKIDQIHEQHFQKQQQLRVQLYDGMMQMRELLASDNPDIKAVGQAYDRIAEVRKKRWLDRLEMSKSLESVLTPEQRKTLRKRWGSPGDLDQSDD